MKRDLFDRLSYRTPKRYRWPKSGMSYWATLWWIVLGVSATGEEVVRTLYG